MTGVGLGKYEIVFDNKHYMREIVETITLEDSLGSIAYCAQIKMLVTPDLYQIGIAPGQKMRVSGIPFGQKAGMVYLLFPGVIWECDSDIVLMKHLDATVYDQTIYLAKSEDEYLFPEGKTASQRLNQYASDWGLTPGKIADTKIPLAKSIYRSQSIYSMIQKDLKETAIKGGDLYRPMIDSNGLNLVKLGSNETVWKFELENNLKGLRQKRTLEGACTQVKVLGSGKVSEDTLAPVLAVEKRDTDKYGTIQKILQEAKIKTAGDAKTASSKVLTGVQETILLTGPDVNTIRAGDKFMLHSGKWDGEWYVISVKHTLGAPGEMSIEAGSLDYIRRKFYA